MPRTRVSMVVLNPYTHDTRVEKEARSLQAAGYRVTVIARGRSDLPDRETRDGIDVRRVRRPPGPPVLRYLRFHRALAKELKASRPNVVHAHDSDTLSVVATTAGEMRVPFVYDAHDLWLGRLRRGRSRLFWGLYRLFYSLVERRYLPRASAWLTVSEPIARHLERRYRLPRVEVVPNVPEIHEPLRRRELRELPGGDAIPPSAPIVLYLGGVMSGRGVEQLVAAMAEIPAAHLVLLGAAEAAAEVRRWAAAAGVSDRVHPLPPVASEAVTAYAASADVGVSPILPSCLNYRYSLPNKLFQYLAGGIPVVASHFDQVREIVEGTGSGISVDPADPGAIAAAINSLLGDPGRREAAGRNARRAVEERFNWTIASRVLLDVYRRVAPAEANRAGRNRST